MSKKDETSLLGFSLVSCFLGFIICSFSVSQKARNKRYQMKFLDVNLKNILPHKTQLNDGAHFNETLCMNNYV